jgi:hypothetical protein
MVCLRDVCVCVPPRCSDLWKHCPTNCNVSLDSLHKLLYLTHAGCHALSRCPCDTVQCRFCNQFSTGLIFGIVLAMVSSLTSARASVTIAAMWTATGTQAKSIQICKSTCSFAAPVIFSCRLCCWQYVCTGAPAAQAGINKEACTKCQSLTRFGWHDWMPSHAPAPHSSSGSL